MMDRYLLAKRAKMYSSDEHISKGAGDGHAHTLLVGAEIAITFLK